MKKKKVKKKFVSVFPLKEIPDGVFQENPLYSPDWNLEVPVPIQFLKCRF